MASIPMDLALRVAGNLATRQHSEQTPDPRVQAIERYMEEQGNVSRMPAFAPHELVPRGIYPETEGEDPEAPTSPDERIKEYMDRMDEERQKNY